MTGRPAVFPEKVQVDARRVGVRGEATRRTSDSEASARSADVGAFLKSSVDRPRQNADASVAKPDRSRSSRLRNTTSRIESSTGDCGTAIADPAAGVVAAAGRLATARPAVSAGLGGVRTLAPDWAEARPLAISVASASAVATAFNVGGRWSMEDCLKR